jgi:hypothetical protein
VKICYFMTFKVMRGDIFKVTIFEGGPEVPKA